jgi:hypothetical protein
MRFFHVLTTMVAALALSAIGSASASAATLYGITYDVRGGSFTAVPNLTGTITGGTVSYKAPAPYLLTPNPGGGYLGVGAGGSITKLTLTGTQGTFKLLSPASVAGAFFYGAFNSFGWQNTGAPIIPNTSSIVRQSGGVTVTQPWRYMVINGTCGTLCGRIDISAPNGVWDIVFTLGNEVRIVPEPASGALLGMGLLGLATASGRLAARARRARRR